MSQAIDYEPTTKRVYSSQSKCSQAWSDGKKPEDGNMLKSSSNYKAYQHDDGSGRIMHYRTLAGIRTRSGLVITNSEDYGRGWAQVTPPKNSDAYLPLSSINSRKHDVDIYQIVEVDGDKFYVEVGNEVHEFDVSEF